MRKGEAVRGVNEKGQQALEWLGTEQTESLLCCWLGARRSVGHLNYELQSCEEILVIPVTVAKIQEIQ